MMRVSHAAQHTAQEEAAARPIRLRAQKQLECRRHGASSAGAGAGVRTPDALCWDKHRQIMHVQRCSAVRTSHASERHQSRSQCLRSRSAPSAPFPLSERNDEVLLRENPSRFVLFPIKYNAIWEMYKKHQAAFWQASEIDLAHDQKDWESLNKDEQFFIKMVLGFFAASDGIVLENLAERFITEVQLPEARWSVPRCAARTCARTATLSHRAAQSHSPTLARDAQLVLSCLVCLLFFPFQLLRIPGLFPTAAVALAAWLLPSSPPLCSFPFSVLVDAFQTIPIRSFCFLAEHAEEQFINQSFQSEITKPSFPFPSAPALRLSLVVVSHLSLVVCFSACFFIS